MSKYNEKELQERYFLFVIVGTLYLFEFGKFIDETYEHRFIYHKQKKDEQIELTPEIVEVLIQ